MTLNDVKATRRRGRELEDALLGAAWEEVTEKGYEAFTIDAVAQRAGTSRAVLYRRWPAKSDLVRAAVLHAGARETVEIPDSGALREDLIELLVRANRSRARIGIMMALHLSGYLAETGTGFSELRGDFLAGRPPAVDTLLARAVERGEVDPARLSPRVVAVPFDLYRQELLMTLTPVPEEVIRSIVDEVFLPLVRPAGWVGPAAG